LHAELPFGIFSRKLFAKFHIKSRPVFSYFTSVKHFTLFRGIFGSCFVAFAK